MTVNILRSTDGIDATSLSNSLAVMTKTVVGSVVVTDATRGRCSSRDISPKKVPGPNTPIGMPLRVASALPETMTKNSLPVCP